jgi:Na+-transporting NADH:ubiquinone oxidoreductase subunit D
MIHSYTHDILDPILDNNPIAVQILGVCSALAVTTSVLPSLIMSISVISVLVFSNLATSLLRHVMPHSIRLIIEVTVIASAVIIVDQVLRAFAPEVAQILSVFVGLIITNCIILGRAEGFAIRNGVVASVADGLGNGIGYSVVLITVAGIRELIGAGSLLGYPILPTTSEGGWFEPNQLMLLAPSAFFVIGLLIWGTKSLRATQIEPQDRVVDARAFQEHA